METAVYGRKQELPTTNTHTHYPPHMWSPHTHIQIAPLTSFSALALSSSYNSTLALPTSAATTASCIWPDMRSSSAWVEA